MEKDFAETQVLCRLVNYKIKMIFEYISFLFKITLFTGGQLC